MLALLAGFVAPAPSTLARPNPPARGPLIAAENHPEWKQFLVQAAHRRAAALEGLRELPDTPMIVSPPDEPPVPTVPVQVADLPPAYIDAAPEDVTGSIEEPAGGEMAIDIGEASATELPIEALDVPMPMQRPETFRRNDSRRKAPAMRRQAKLRKPPAAPAPEPDFFTRLFGGTTTQQPQAQPR